MTPCLARQHGTANAYRNHYCRCPSARTGNTRYNKLRKAGLTKPGWVPAIGVIRRRRALAAMGYSLDYLAARLGKPPRAVGNYMRRAHVTRAVHLSWCELYDELAMVPGPSQRARDYARKQGWPPPLAWEDSRIDDPRGKPLGIPRRPRTAGLKAAA